MNLAQCAAWRDCAAAWRKVADDMRDAEPELARRAMARSETFEYCADTLAAATSEIQRLGGICEHVHDRMLRGDDDMTLMRKLQEAWQGPNDPSSAAGGETLLKT